MICLLQFLLSSRTLIDLNGAVLQLCQCLQELGLLILHLLHLVLQRSQVRSFLRQGVCIRLRLALELLDSLPCQSHLVCDLGDVLRLPFRLLADATAWPLSAAFSDDLVPT